MKLIYRGKFSGNPDDLPRGEHQPGAVQFREFEDPKKLSLVANLIALGITALAIAGYVLRLFLWGQVSSASLWGWQFMLGALLSLVALVPHEFLHALCFRKEVYLYTYAEKGMLFVVGPEDMSRFRFVFMSLLPNLVFGVLPYLLAMFWPSLGLLGVLGAISLGSGAGDYVNVFNALTQMPRRARTYLHGFHSWWYLPEGMTPPEKTPWQRPAWLTTLLNKLHREKKPREPKPVREKTPWQRPAWLTALLNKDPLQALKAKLAGKKSAAGKKPSAAQGRSKGSSKSRGGKKKRKKPAGKGKKK